MMVCFLLLLSNTGSVLADAKKEEPKPYASASAAFFSRYIFRGYELSKDSLVIQPSVTIGYRGFELGLWGNLDTNDKFTGIKKANWNETDLTLSYTHDFGPMKLSGGYIYYALDQVRDSHELFLKLTGNFFLNPTLSVYREIDFYTGTYLNLSLSHSFNLAKEITLDLAGSVGYQISNSNKIVKFNSSGYPTKEKYRGLHDGNISTGLTIPFSKYFTLKPIMTYTFPLSSNAKDRIKGTSLSNRGDFFWGGAVLTFAF